MTSAIRDDFVLSDSSHIADMLEACAQFDLIDESQFSTMYSTMRSQFIAKWKAKQPRKV